MANTDQRLVEIIIKGQQANATLKEIEAASRAAKAQLKGMATNSAEFAAKSKELQQINKRLNAIKDDINSVGGVFGKIGKEIKAFGVIAMGALSFEWLSSKISNLISQNAKLSDSFADIQKTTGMSKREVENLNKAFSQMNTRTSTKELRDIAVAAGQLGIGKKDILAFTDATDKLVVSLGDEFAGGAEQVTKEMGALRNVFTDIKSDNIADDMLHIGNAINELASAGAATGPVVSDFANRIGGVGINLGLTSGQVLGLSATLQELNVSTAIGGTAVTKILMKMTQETDKFAKVAGMGTKEFTDLVNNDLYAAFVKVAEGSKKSGASATEFSKILDTLGVDGAGASEVFSKLGSNTGLLKEKVDLANESLGKTDGIMKEFNTKNETFAAKIEKLGKSLTAAFVNGPIMKGMEWMVDGLLKLTRNTHAASDAMKQEQLELEKAKIKVLSYNVGTEERTKLVRELQQQYPEYLGNLKAETASNDQLRAAIDGVIESMINKIIVQRKEEDLAEQAENIADAKEEQLIAEMDLLEALRRAYKDNAEARQRSGNAQIKLMEKELEGLPIMLQAQELLDAKNSGLSRMNENVVGVAEALEKMKQAEVAYNSELLKGNDIQKEKDELMARLGISGPKGTRVDPEKDVRVQSEAAANDKIQKEREKLLENLSKLEIEYYQKGLDADTKEIADIHQKYQALLKEAGDFGAARMRINKLYNKEISDALQRQAEEDAKKNAERLRKRQDIEDEIYLATLNSKDRELVAEMQKWDALILEAEKYGIDATALRQAQANAIAGIVAAQGKKELEETKKTEDEKAKLRKQKTQEALAMYQQFSGAVVGIITALEEQHKLADERELASNDRTLTAEQKRNEEFHRAGLIDQKEFDKRQLKAQAEHDKHEAEIKKRAAERAKKIAIQNAIINGIASVVQTLASAPYPYNLVLAALQAATVAIQVDTLRSTPAYAKGGYNLTSNDPQGYTKDSTLYTNSASGQDFIAGEKGKEWIAPNWMVTAPQTAPIIEHLESIRQSRTFAAGGSTVATKTGKMPQFTQSNSSGDMVRLTSAIERLNTILDGGIFSVWDWDYFNKTINRAEGAKNSARQ